MSGIDDIDVDASGSALVGVCVSISSTNGIVVHRANAGSGATYLLTNILGLEVIGVSTAASPDKPLTRLTFGVVEPTRNHSFAEARFR
jgi:hypothetical protein